MNARYFLIRISIEICMREPRARSLMKQRKCALFRQHCGMCACSARSRATRFRSRLALRMPAAAREHSCSLAWMQGPSRGIFQTRAVGALRSPAPIRAARADALPRVSWALIELWSASRTATAPRHEQQRRKCGDEHQHQTQQHAELRDRAGTLPALTPNRHKLAATHSGRVRGVGCARRTRNSRQHCCAHAP